MDPIRQDVPDKPAGSWYVITFRDPETSILRRGLTEFLKAKLTYPVPAVGDACVCCDGPAESFESANAMTRMPQVYQATVEVPVCANCRAHARLNRSDGLWISFWTASVLAAAFLLCVSVVAYPWGAILFVSAGFAVSAVIAVHSWRARSRRIAASGKGHHPRLWIQVREGQCIVRTTNRRLVRALVERDPGRRLTVE